MISNVIDKIDSRLTTLLISNMSKNFFKSPCLVNMKQMKRRCSDYEPVRLNSGHLVCLKELVLVEDIGVEPMTLCVQGRCSSQLS